MAAALEAAEAGAEVLLIDNRHGPGGQYFKQPSKGFHLDETVLDAQYRAGRKLIARMAASSVRTVNETRVWALSGPDRLHAASPTHRYTLSARVVVLATGAFERGVPFPGWTLPGVMTTGAAQTLLRSYLVAAGHRVLISGNGPLCQGTARIPCRRTRDLHVDGHCFSSPADSRIPCGRTTGSRARGRRELDVRFS